tara:strand:+ start:90 stop:326 length:237 start_codon:yes stop_codon:yes gene_type:complete
MKNLFYFFLSFIITLNSLHSQCNQETIPYDNGDYTVKDVIAVVPIRDDINDLLIGIGFLKKFKEVLWSLNSNLMRFYK